MLRIILISVLVQGVAAGSVAAQDPTAAARRLIATTSLAAKEYALGVADGRIVAPAEVEEALLFVAEARRAAEDLPDSVAGPAIRDLDALLGLIRRTADPEEVAGLARAVTARVGLAVGVEHETMPSGVSFAAGEPVYARSCASCHGAAGRGDGRAGVGLDPPPADLTDRVGLADQSPLDFYRKIAYGVAGTAMPPFEGTLSDEEMWAAAWYALRLRFPAKEASEGRALLERLRAAPGELADPVVGATLSDLELADRLRALSPGLDSAGALRVVAHLRTLPFDRRASRSLLVRARFAAVRSGLGEALAGVERGTVGEAAASRYLDAYLRFEAVEADLRARDAGLTSRIEERFASLRLTAVGGDVAAVRSEHARLLEDLERAERTIVGRASGATLFAQSFVLLLREGFEAILIVAALATFVVRSGVPERRRDLWWGVALALGASAVTAILLEAFFRAGPVPREILEGATMLLATVVLFSVAYWLLSKVEAARWQAFVRERVRHALSTGSHVALGAVAFLAVYREGFETILFYRALVITAEGAGLGAIAGGALVAAAALVVVYYLVARLGLRLPLKPFFAATSAVLLYMAFVFAGKGVVELQEGGVVPATLLPGAPRLPMLGIYPTAESLVVQGVIVVLVIAGLCWTLWLAPTRRRVAATPATGADPAPPQRADVAKAAASPTGARAGSRQR